MPVNRVPDLQPSLSVLIRCALARWEALSPPTASDASPLQACVHAVPIPGWVRRCLPGAPDLLQLLLVALEWVLGLQLPALYESSPFQDLPCHEDPSEVPSVSLCRVPSMLAPSPGITT